MINLMRLKSASIYTDQEIDKSFNKLLEMNDLHEKFFPIKVKSILNSNDLNFNKNKVSI